jgi:ParB family chromosome partitioning protein
VDGPTYRQIPHTAIRPNPRQPRSVFDEDALAELVASLREVGMLQPIVVRPLAEPDDDGVAYELVMGERRWRAAAAAGFTHVPALVRHTDDAAMLRDALLENLHRSQLNPLEEAAAYAQLLDEFQVTHDQLAGRIGRSRSQVSNTIRLLGLPPQVQRRVAAGVLSAGHARALLSLPDADSQDELATRIVAEGLSVRAVEELAALGRTSTDRPTRGGRPRQRRADPRADELGARVAERLDTRVTVELARGRSRLVVEAGDLDDLARIVELIAGPPSSP